jgi:aryl-alcohol dehydrogenase-like predicted oxidoreductase
MKYRNLGKNGFRVSEIGLGCWQLGGDWGEDPVEEDKALSILRAAVVAGVNLFDTADVYGGGRSEKIIGKFLRETHAEVRVITKYGQGAGIYPDNYTEKSLRNGVEGSLDRLGLTSLDLLQLHCIPQAVLEKGEVFGWLRKLKKEGLIKNFGASVETETEGLICMEQEGLSSLQVIFNLFRQHYGQNFFSKASEKGVGIIVRLPLASGLLSGKFNRETRFSEKDHRNYNRDGAAFNVGETFSGLSFDKGLDLIEKLKRHFLPKHMSMVEFSLRWILDHSAVSTIIPGASTVEQARANARISELSPLPRELHDKLNIFYTQEVLPHIRGPY